MVWFESKDDVRRDGIMHPQDARNNPSKMKNHRLHFVHRGSRGLGSLWLGNGRNLVEAILVYHVVGGGGCYRKDWRRGGGVRMEGG